MQYRTFGGTGLRVSELFLGAMTFGEQGGVGAPIEECRRIVNAYADAGGNVIDTAINYRGGASEEILGELLAGRRNRFVLGSKCPILGARHADQLIDNLGSLEVALTGDAIKRLEDATNFDIGFPSAFISDNSSWVFGAAQHG